MLPTPTASRGQTPTDKKPPRRTKSAIYGYVFVCDRNTEATCFAHNIFGATRRQWTVVERIDQNTRLFLLNKSTHIVYGPFEAVMQPSFNVRPELWNGRFPSQVYIRARARSPADKDAILMAGARLTAAAVPMLANRIGLHGLRIHVHPGVMHPSATKRLCDALESTSASAGRGRQAPPLPPPHSTVPLKTQFVKLKR